jgi:hypothetical protein
MTVTDDDIIATLESLLAGIDLAREDVIITLGNIGHEVTAIRQVLRSGEEPMLPLLVAEEYRRKALLAALAKIYSGVFEALNCLTPLKPKPAAQQRNGVKR